MSVSAVYPNLAVVLLAAFEHLNWVIAGLIVVVGLFVLGLADVARFSWKRVWAISSVAFDESIRKRVLWITPLAILGVIIVVQLQRPLDEMDAVRQTSKFCLFTTGLLVSVSAIILACTNLPKEIENRVIYTVVTKPTTRLEIVLGKIVGFARVSGLILLIMGVFSYAYLQVRAWSLRKSVVERLDAGLVDLISRPSLEHYRDTGLLSAKTLRKAGGLQFYAQLPDAKDARRWMSGEGTQNMLIPFDTDGAIAADGSTPGMFVELNVGWRHVAPGTPSTDEDVQEDFSVDKPNPTTVKYEGESETKSEPASQPATRPVTLKELGPTPFLVPNEATGGATPSVTLTIFGSNMEPLLAGAQINGGKPIELSTSGEPDPTRVFIVPPELPPLSKSPRLWLQIIGPTKGVDYFTGAQPARLIIPANGAGGSEKTIEPAFKSNEWNPVPAVFRGRTGTFGQQLRGLPHNKGPVAIYQFQHTQLSAIDGKVPFELRSGIERQGKDSVKDADDVTDVTVRLYNHQTHQMSEPISAKPESNRSAYFDVPAEAVAGGDFDVILQCQTQGHWLGLTNESLQVVASQESFGLNLIKSLLILWLMSILVIVISIFCSTFLSWPIAIVLTLVILLGRWGVEQLGDATQAGIGRQVATDFGMTDASKMVVVSTSVEALTKYLNTVASVLPDISRFSATEDIERGVNIGADRLLEALGVIGGFGVPMTVLAYIFLKNKEVAP